MPKMPWLLCLLQIILIYTDIFTDDDITGFINQDSINVIKKTKKSEKEVDIKPLIYSIKKEDNGIFIKLAQGSAQNLKPELVVTALENFTQKSDTSYIYERLDMYCTEDGKLIFLDNIGSDIGENMDNRLIISDFYNNILLGFYFINDELYRIQNFSDNSLIGNIYCGYVKDVVKNIDAAFVEFGDNLKGFLSLKNIEKKPKSGGKILVQVAGDKIKTKDYALTLKLNLSSDNLVMVVGGSGISISRKITDNDTRNRLKSSLSSLDTGEYGFILRTSGADCSMEDILAQADLLKKQYEDILNGNLIFQLLKLCFLKTTKLLMHVMNL